MPTDDGPDKAADTEGEVEHAERQANVSKVQTAFMSVGYKPEGMCIAQAWRLRGNLSEIDADPRHLNGDEAT